MTLWSAPLLSVSLGSFILTLAGLSSNIHPWPSYLKGLPRDCAVPLFVWHLGPSKMAMLTLWSFHWDRRSGRWGLPVGPSAWHRPCTSPVRV